MSACDCRPTLDELAQHPEWARDLSPEAARDLLARLATLQGVLLAQALQPPASASSQPEAPTEDRLLTPEEAAAPPPVQAEDGEALTPAQVAARWNLKVRHVQRLCRTGQLPAFHPPGSKVWRIPKAVLDNTGVGTILYNPRSANGPTGHPAYPTPTRPEPVTIRRAARRECPDHQAVGGGRSASTRPGRATDPAARG